MGDPSDSVLDLGALVRILRGDVSLAEARLDSQVDRRAWVRAVFAYFEGVTFLWKQYIVDVAPRATKRPGAEEFLRATETDLVAREIDVRLNDKGEPKKAHRAVRLLQNIRFTHLLATRVFAAAQAPQIDYGECGWKAMGHAKDVRNRLTHPRSPKDCDVTDDEVSTVREALRWFDDADREIRRVAREAYSGHYAV